MPSGVYFFVSRLIRRLAAASRTTLILSALLCSCVTREGRERAVMLSLSYDEFDQTYGSGFRVLYDRGDYFQGAVLIEDYLQAHPKLTAHQQKLLHLHAAQLFALAGRNARAIAHLDQAVCSGTVQEPWPNWNDNLAATKAFLAQDRTGLLAARDRITAARLSQHVDNLVENLGSSYADVLLWHQIYPKVGFPQDASKAHQAAAEKLAKTFGFPLTALETKPQTSCIWLELGSFEPNSTLGYVIIHSRDGTVITASNPYWLEAAIERFIKLSRKRKAHYEARFGLATSFDVPK